MAQTRNFFCVCETVSIFYIMTLLGNSAIIILSCLDPRLHTPCISFCLMSYLDLWYTTSTVSQMLVSIQSHWRNTSYIGCIAQLFFFLGLGSTECILSVMSFDCQVTICQPLHYSYHTFLAVPTIDSSGLGKRFQQLFGVNSVDFLVTMLWSVSGGEFLL